MSELSAALPQAPPAAPLDTAPSLKRWRWFELLLVLTIAFSDSIRSSLYLLKHGPNPALTPHQWRDRLLVFCSCGYVLHRRGWKLQNLGLRWSFLSVFVGLLLAAAHFFVYLLAFTFLSAKYRA